MVSNSLSTSVSVVLQQLSEHVILLIDATSSLTINTFVKVRYDVLDGLHALRHSH